MDIKDKILGCLIYGSLGDDIPFEYRSYQCCALVEKGMDMSNMNYFVEITKNEFNTIKWT
jgi:hypothetical protein